MKLQNNNCFRYIRAEDVFKLSSLAIKNFHYHEKVLQRKKKRVLRCGRRQKVSGKDSHQILTKQLKVILGFESGKRWKE